MTFVDHAEAETAINGKAEALHTHTGADLVAYTFRTITANYTLTSSDEDGVILYVTASSGVTITLPTGLNSGKIIPWVVAGTGAATFTAGSGATRDALGGTYTSAGQFSQGTILTRPTDAFLIGGNLA